MNEKRFKVGDIVKGMQQASKYYMVTGSNSILRVVEVYEEEEIIKEGGQYSFTGLLLQEGYEKHKVSVGRTFPRLMCNHFELLKHNPQKKEFNI